MYGRNGSHHPWGAWRSSVSRVLLVGKGAPDRGGIARFLDQLRSGEVACSHQVDLLNVAHGGTVQAGRVTLGNLGRTAADTVAVWRAARGHDVCHIHSALAPAVTCWRAGMFAAAARVGGCSVVVHAHGGNLETWLTTRRARWVCRAAMAPAHQVVAVWSAGLAALDTALGPGRAQLIDNGVDVRVFRPSPHVHSAVDSPVVLYVGLLTARKGVLDLIEASARLRRDGVAHRLRLVGGIPDEGPAAAEPVLAAARSHAVEVAGARPPEQMPQAYAEADVAVLPSWWEAMPLSVLEAMASGLPVVATEVGDIPRAVVDGETGYLVPPRNPEALSAALRKLLVDRDLRAALGAAGRRRVEQRFSSTATAAAVSAVYAEVAEPRT